MVQGLAFLSKKSWHVKNLANQEKVWVAEQQQQAEAAKTQELAKQIQHEREREELEALTGKKTTLDRGIDWMYQGQNAQSEIAEQDAIKKSEEYLLGKEYVPEGAIKGDLDDGQAMEGVNAVLAAATVADTAGQSSTAYSEQTVAERNEAFRVRHEDPMFAVSTLAYQKTQQHERNKELYEKVVGGVAVDEKRRSKKEKKRKRDREESPGRRSSRKHHRRDRKAHADNEHYDRRRRNDSKEKDHHRRHDRRDGREHSQSHEPRHPRIHRSQRPSPKHHERRDHGGDYSHHRCQYDRSSSVDSRNRSLSRERRGHGRNYRTPEYDYSKSQLNHQEVRSDRLNNDKARDDCEPCPTQYATVSPQTRAVLQKQKGYGLQNAPGRSKSSIMVHPQQLGPNQELLRRKRQEQQEEHRRVKELKSNRRLLTSEEKTKALRDMETAAHRQEATRTSLSKHREKEDPPRLRNAAFLEKLSQQANGMHGEGVNLADRVSRNRNTNQKLHDKFL
jgi:hypothetical protein